jgi:hypothetical protein
MHDDSGSEPQQHEGRAFRIVPTDRRGFLRKLIVGSAFVPPVVSSFALGVSRAFGKTPGPEDSPPDTFSNQSFLGEFLFFPHFPNQTFPNQTFPNQTFFFPSLPSAPPVPQGDLYSKQHTE